jgi:uncharacterized protein YjiS (DUF1127 family)
MSSAYPDIRPAEIRPVVRRAGDAIRALWAGYRKLRTRRRELAELSAMDDMALRDIGISRLEIRATVRSDTDPRLVGK